MTSKQYNIWNSENIYQAPATRDLKTDFWSTLTKATLVWTVSGTAGFDNIQFNGVTVGTAANGSADVTTIVKKGQNNNVTLNYRCDWSTIFLGQAAGNARVYLTISGVIATYDIVLAQNAVFKTALENGEITQTQYNEQIAFQNNVLQQLLALNLISAAQYEAAISAQNQSNTNTGNGSGSGGTVIIDNNASQSGSGLSLPKIVLIIAAVAVLILGFMYYRSTQP